MSVGNKSFDRKIQHFQNVQPFQIQDSNFQNPPINQNPYPRRKYLTVPHVVPQAQPTQCKMCQHKEMPSFTWIFLVAQSAVKYSSHLIYDIFLLYDIG